MAPSSAAIYLNLTRERRTFLCRSVSASAEYRIFICAPYTLRTEPLDIEGVPNLRGVCCGKWSWLQQCHTQNRMQRVVGLQALPRSLSV